MKTRAIIDADSLLWTLAYSLKDKDPGNHMHRALAHKRLEDTLSFIIERTNAASYIAYIGCNEHKCFRHHIWAVKPYKGNRKPKDPWFEMWEPHLRSLCLDYYNFRTTPYLEADDAVSIAARIYQGDGVICSPDKDLKQVPGQHFDYRQDVLGTISEDEATYNLYYQMLTGDSSDNIAGLEGCGPVAAKKSLDGVPAFKLRYAVLHLFVEKYGEYEGTKRFFSTYRLVKMLTPEQAADFNFMLPTSSDFKPLELSASSVLQEAVTDLSDLMPKVP